MNLDIFSNKDNIEQEYILKYFFLTDPIALAKDIIDKFLGCLFLQDINYI